MNPPKSIVVAAVIGVGEAAVMVLFAVLEMIHLASARLAMGLTTSAFFLVTAAALVACAWGLMHLHSIARSPLVLMQLIFLGVASSFLGTPAVAAAIALVAIACLVAVMHPESIKALEAS